MWRNASLSCAGEPSQGMVSVGFELFFPKNTLPFDLNFTVRRKTEQPKIVV